MIAPERAWHLILGPTVWGIWFVTVYGALSIGCVVAPPPAQGPWNWLNLSLGVFTLLVAGLLLRWAWGCWHALRAAGPQQTPRRRFIRSLGAGLHLMSALATLLIGLPILLLTPCL